MSARIILDVSFLYVFVPQKNICGFWLTLIIILQNMADDNIVNTLQNKLNDLTIRYQALESEYIVSQTTIEEYKKDVKFTNMLF